MVRLVASAAVAAALFLLVPPAHAFQRFPAGCARADFSSGGATVRAELCESTRGAPAVVVLHGCGGFSTFDHRLAVELPRTGIATLDVDYFQPTPPPGRKGFCDAGGSIGSAFPVWQREAVDAAAALRVRGFAKVGVVGWSMGGGVALASAELRSHPFGALAAFSTGGFGEARAAVKSLPPTILLSGGPHDAIPASDTRALYEAIRAGGVPATLFVYGNGSHNWPRRQGTVGIAKAAAFLHAHLG